MTNDYFSNEQEYGARFESSGHILSVKEQFALLTDAERSDIMSEYCRCGKKHPCYCDSGYDE